MLGISYYAVSSDYTYSAIAWQNNLPYGSIVIAAIAENNDLVNNGIQVGDIIIGVNGTPLDSTDILLEVIEDAKVGDTITLTICRLDNSGKVSSKFDAKVKLVEDKGETNLTPQQQQQQQQDPFSSYFEDYFGY
jgi:S1-C subfamily serine protease